MVYIFDCQFIIVIVCQTEKEIVLCGDDRTRLCSKSCAKVVALGAKMVALL